MGAGRRRREQAGHRLGPGAQRRGRAQLQRHGCERGDGDDHGEADHGDGHHGERQGVRRDAGGEHRGWRDHQWCGHGGGQQVLHGRRGGEGGRGGCRGRGEKEGGGEQVRKRLGPGGQRGGRAQLQRHGWERGDVGVNKPVTVSGLALSGADALNYSVTDASGATATITAKPITATGITASGKVYDATPVASIAGGVITNGAATAVDNKYYTGDAVAREEEGGVGEEGKKKVGGNKSEKDSGLAVSGADALNYSVTDGSGATSA